MKHSEFIGIIFIFVFLAHEEIIIYYHRSDRNFDVIINNILHSELDSIVGTTF